MLTIKEFDMLPNGTILCFYWGKDIYDVEVKMGENKVMTIADCSLHTIARSSYVGQETKVIHDPQTTSNKTVLRCREVAPKWIQGVFKIG